MVGEEIFVEREEIKTKIRNELQDILQHYVYSVSEIKEIDNEFIRAESTTLRLIEKIDLLLKKYETIKNLTLKNANIGSQANEMSNIINDINLIKLVLEQVLDNIIKHLKEAIKIILYAMEETAKINRSDIMEKVLMILRNLDMEKSRLQTTKYLFSTINYYYNLFNKNNPNYFENMKIECQKEELKNRLDTIKESLIKNIINKETKVRRNLWLLKPIIENTITTI